MPNRPRQASMSSNELEINFMRLSRPILQNSHDLDNPNLPPLPQMQLSIPKSSQPVYVGEKFQGIFIVQNVVPELAKDFNCVLSIYILNPQMVEKQRIELGDDILLVKEEFTIGESIKYKSINFEFDVPEPGNFKLIADLRFNGRKIQREFPLESPAQNAISVRTKVSKGSSGMQAYILETQVENLTDSLMVIESCGLVAKNEWQVTNLQLNKSVVVILRPRDVRQYSFILRNGTSHEAGNVSVTWRRDPLGAKGWQQTGLIRV